MLLLFNFLVVDNLHQCCHQHYVIDCIFQGRQWNTWYHICQFLHLCNFLKIDVLYQGQPVIHSELFLSISYCSCSYVSNIHNITTWCSIVFNKKVVIISWYVVFKLSTNIIFSFPQLLHLIEIFTPVFFILSYLGFRQQLILSIKNSFNDYGKSVLSLSILSAVNPMILKR